MRPARTELTLTEWIVLAVIGESPNHGWAIARSLRPEGSLGAVWSSRAPLVYRAIRLLEEAGLVTSTGSAAGRGPSRTVLGITPAGSQAVGEWLIEPVAHVRDLRTELLVKLLLHERLGQDPSLLVGRQRERLMPIAAGLTDRVPAASGGERLVVAWRAKTAQAALEFLETVGAAGAVEPERLRR